MVSAEYVKSELDHLEKHLKACRELLEHPPAELPTKAISLASSAGKSLVTLLAVLKDVVDEPEGAKTT